MLKEYRGRIPFLLNEYTENIVYLCSSNRNIEDYYNVLVDIFDGKILKFESSIYSEELEKDNYELLETLTLDKRFVILISLEAYLREYFSSGKKYEFKLGKKIDLKEFIEELEKMTHTLDYCELFNSYLTYNDMKLSLLIAEDVEDNREFLKAILVSDRIKVTCVENGLLALKELQNKNFDAIFLDIRMPVMDGLQTIKHIRDKKLYSSTPILALTAQAIIGDKEKYLPYGFDGYITKPINESVLFSYLYYVANWKKLLSEEKGELQ